jgi:hypothetical protein
MKVTPANTSLFGEDAGVVKAYFESFSECLAVRGSGRIFCHLFRYF